MNKETKTKIVKRTPRKDKVTSVTVSSRRVGRSSRSRSDASSGASAASTAYLNTLNDPFEYGPVRLGWGTLAPTQLATAYFRATYDSNASDGSIAFMVLPALNITGISGPILVNNSGASGTTWSPQAFSNATVITNSFSEARICSYGIKAYPQIPATDSPGVLYAGSVNGLAYSNTSGTITPNILAGQPWMKMAVGYGGACALGRPCDPDSFVFFSGNITSAQTQIGYNTIPIINFLGLPASTPVVIEVVMNLEGLLGPQTSTDFLQGTGQVNSNDNATLSNYFPNVETMYRTLSGKISDSGTLGAISDLVHTSARAAGRAAVHAASAAITSGAASMAQRFGAALTARRAEYFSSASSAPATATSTLPRSGASSSSSPNGDADYVLMQRR